MWLVWADSKLKIKGRTAWTKEYKNKLIFALLMEISKCFLHCMSTINTFVCLCPTSVPSASKTFCWLHLIPNMPHYKVTLFSPANLPALIECFFDRLFWPKNEGHDLAVMRDDCCVDPSLSLRAPEICANRQRSFKPDVKGHRSNLEEGLTKDARTFWSASYTKGWHA